LFRKIKLQTRNSIGSNSLYTNFTSLSGSLEKFSYYTFINYKIGDGFRLNSQFESMNLFSYFDIDISKRLNVSFEITYLTYLAQQAGGLTDKMFYDNIFQSTRERNWFKINWFLYNSKVSFKLNKDDNISLNIFVLDASRFSLGYRDRVDQIDPLNERDLIKGFFNNYGFEARYLNKYKFLSKNAVFLSGIKYYRSDNISEQGAGSAEYNANFDDAYNEYPFYNNQAFYNYPNLNMACFFENIFYIDSSLSLTPGLRYEYIDTKSDGYYRAVYLNLVDQPIYDTTIFNSNQNKRNFFLLGIGASYKYKYKYEIYTNISQNYRSVTFADITISSPTFLIDPNISDESGYSFDIGLRGSNNSFLRFDLNYFGLNYNDRIGFLQKKVEFLPGVYSVKTQKGNVGDAFINGLEGLIDLSFKNLFKELNFSSFVNYSYTKSKYLRSESEFIVGNKVEFTPKHNLKCGFNFNYKRFMLGLQSTYLSDQFTDAANSTESDISGILGIIPSYHILDFSSRINFKNTKLFFGINNVLNNYYFTRRSTGYPGPGIIPSQTRNYYFTIEFNY
jgi:Fe(3+) dicitrate transport protein